MATAPIPIAASECCQSAKVGQHRTREGNGYEEWRESVAAFTLRTNDLVSSLRSWAASALLTCDWDTLCSFHEVLYPLNLSGFLTP